MDTRGAKDAATGAARIVRCVRAVTYKSDTWTLKSIVVASGVPNEMSDPAATRQQGSRGCSEAAVGTRLQQLPLGHINDDVEREARAGLERRLVCHGHLKMTITIDRIDAST
jgi:hypothetical protein